MSTFCGSGNSNFSKYTKNTKFKESEIKNFYMYFKRFCSDGETLNLDEFKRSLGILGSNKRNFICERLFQLIDKEEKQRVKINKIYIR